MRRMHLRHPVYKTKSLCQRSTHEQFYILEPASLLIELLSDKNPNPICAYCKKKIKKQTSLLNSAKNYLSEEIYGLALLKFM